MAPWTTSAPAAAAASIDATLPAGTHTLDVAAGGVTIRGHDAEALFHGAQSLLALVRIGVPTVPAVAIVDGPRFAYRGMHIDVARNFQSTRSILKLIDQMAAYKLNRLHLHLSDDEGWRLEIPGLPELTGVTYHTYVMVLGGLAIIYLFPRVTRAIPSPLVTIVVLTAITLWLDLPVNRVGEMGKLPDSLPFFALPAVPLTLATFKIILPFSIKMAAVGLLESLLTAQIVDDLTDTPSDKRRESMGQGFANFVTGFFGGMGGCAMIGQSVINVKSGGHTRLSTMVAGVFLLFLIVVLGRQQLFTENTLTVVLPTLARLTWSTFGELGRVWGTVLMANWIGCVLIAPGFTHLALVPDDVTAAVSSTHPVTTSG